MQYGLYNFIIIDTYLLFISEEVHIGKKKPPKVLHEAAGLLMSTGLVNNLFSAKKIICFLLKKLSLQLETVTKRWPARLSVPPLQAQTKSNTNDYYYQANLSVHQI